MRSSRFSVRSSRSILAAAILAPLLACGGGNDGGDDGGGGTTPPATNPCTAAALAEQALEGPAVPAPPAFEKRRVIDGDVRWRVLDSIWTHRAVRGIAPFAPSAAPVDAADIGEIAVVQDEGEVVAPVNRYDLRDTGLRFTRNAQGGYDVSRIDGRFRSPIGSPVTLTDDDTREVALAAAVSFYGRSFSTAFVNSDGNVTFEEGDKASTERNVARLLTGPPRAAPFLADLDPSTGGRVHVQSDATAFTVTWCGVRGFESTNTATVQASMFPDGTVEMKFGTITLTDAVVGLSPGRTGTFTPVNLSDAASTAGGTGAVGERFSASSQLDTVALTRKFYQTHPDLYDQLVIWTDQRLVRDAFAFEVTVANEIHGIGLDLFDLSRDFGSAGRLRSLAVMDALGRYPDDPRAKFLLGENTTLSVLGQEVGHRWLAFMRFRDHNRQISEALLGRGLSHWSFFFDSDASVMEGNDIQDLGGGSFRTVDAVRRYSRLDQYAMGLLEAHEVPMFFYVESPTNVTPFNSAGDDPQIGVTFNGTRRDVLVQDIIAVHGERIPSARESPRVHRQAFIYVVSAGRSLDTSQVTKLDRIRREWEAFFSEATDGRMRVETRLRPPS